MCLRGLFKKKKKLSEVQCKLLQVKYVTSQQQLCGVM